jgi:hypothetical protein
VVYDKNGFSLSNSRRKRNLYGVLTPVDLYIKGNVENLTNVPASILADWKKNGWVEPYKGPVE